METKTKTIGGHTYQVTQLGALKARRLQVVLLRALGPAMAALVKSDGTEDGLAKGLAALAQSAREDDLDTLCDVFAGVTKVLIQTQTANGPGTLPMDLAPIFDQHFAGRTLAMDQWLAFSIQVSFSDFFDASAGGLAGLFRRAPSASTSPTT
jgi:hypothetical protein